ncbi:hypothetical protein ACFQYP_36055 [Nonomuraea antimicrobica]
MPVDGDDRDLTLMVGDSLVACGRVAEARELLAGRPGAALLLARWLHGHGDPEGALAALTAEPPEATGRPSACSARCWPRPAIWRAPRPPSSGRRPSTRIRSR